MMQLDDEDLQEEDDDYEGYELMPWFLVNK